MNAEFGQITLLGALLISVVLGTLPLIGASSGNRKLMGVATNAAIAQFMLVAAAFAMLTWAFWYRTSRSSTWHATAIRNCPWNIDSQPSGVRTRAPCCCGS
jgi:cytochrome c-type biogenesis protein CcmF